MTEALISRFIDGDATVNCTTVQPSLLIFLEGRPAASLTATGSDFGGASSSDVPKVVSKTRFTTLMKKCVFEVDMIFFSIFIKEGLGIWISLGKGGHSNGEIFY